MISQGCINYPDINSGTANCLDLTLESGGRLEIFGGLLNVNDRLEIYGDVIMGGGDIEVVGDIFWRDGCTVAISDGNVHCGGNCVFQYAVTMDISMGGIYIDNDLDIYEDVYLTMQNTEIDVGGDITWRSGCNCHITGGSIHCGGNWTFDDNCYVDFSGDCAVYLDGVGPQYIFNYDSYGFGGRILFHLCPGSNTNYTKDCSNTFGLGNRRRIK